jgi:hypothetical protein
MTDTPHPPSASAAASPETLAAQYAQDQRKASLEIHGAFYDPMWADLRVAWLAGWDACASWQRAQSAEKPNALFDDEQVADSIACGVGPYLTAETLKQIVLRAFARLRASVAQSAPPAPQEKCVNCGKPGPTRYGGTCSRQCEKDGPQPPQEAPAGYHLGQTCRCQVPDCGCPSRLIPDSPSSSASSFAERARELADTVISHKFHWGQVAARETAQAMLSAFAQQVAAESEAKYGPLVKAAESAEQFIASRQRYGKDVLPAGGLKALLDDLRAALSPLSPTHPPALPPEVERLAKAVEKYLTVEAKHDSTVVEEANAHVELNEALAAVRAADDRRRDG